MGAEDIKDDELEAFGVEIVKQTDSGSRSLKISENGLPTYINLVKEKLTKGFWNEIVGPKEILFIFKFEDGHIEEFILSPENEPRVDKLCAEFNDETPDQTTNVYKYIADNDFYHDYMLEHYSEMINR